MQQANNQVETLTIWENLDTMVSMNAYRDTLRLLYRILRAELE